MFKRYISWLMVVLLLVGAGILLLPVTFSALAQPSAPVALDDTFTVEGNGRVNSAYLQSFSAPGVLSNDSGDGITVTSFTQTARGSVRLNVDGSFDYERVPLFLGTDSFTYTITDAAGQTATATVTLNVVLPPIAAQDDVFTVPYNSQNNELRILLNDVYSAYRPPQDIITGPAHGTASFAPFGAAVFYTPNNGFSGTDTFRYRLTDGFGQTDEATVTITITGGTTALRAVDDTFELLGTGDVSSPIMRDFSAPGVLTNDSGDGIRVSSYTQPGNSNLRDLIVNADGSFRFVLYPLFVGTDTFTYTITDAAGHTATATVTLNVIMPPLDAVDDQFTVEFESRDNYLQFVRNDSYSARRPRIEILSGPSHGSVSQGSYGTIAIYQPDPGFSGTDGFRYRLTDGFGQTDEATVMITVLPPGPIDAIDDFFELSSDSPGLVANVLQNDHGVGLHVTEHTQPAHGTIHNMSEDGWFGYTPEPGFIGNVVFYYTVYDANGQRDASTVTITITQGSQPPPPSPTPPPPPSVPLDAIDDFYTMTTADATLTANVLANDSGSGLSVTQWNDPDHGSISGAADGSFVYTPEPGYVGTAVFYYTLYDANGARDASTVTLTITQGSQPPPPPPPPSVPLDAIDDFYTMTSAEATLTGNVLANDIGSGLSVTQWNDPDHGSISGAADGSFVYTPEPGYVGTVIFYYTVYDAAGVRDASTVMITVVAAVPAEGSTSP
ncbi:MAG: Ig-like domain-containing protein [Chloroflexota bacterium]|nr:Ig-like domain-containing protein [Chloroflexota bacterium]